MTPHPYELNIVALCVRCDVPKSQHSLPHAILCAAETLKLGLGSRRDQR